MKIKKLNLEVNWLLTASNIHKARFNRELNDIKSEILRLEELENDIVGYQKALEAIDTYTKVGGSEVLTKEYCEENLTYWRARFKLALEEIEELTKKTIKDRGY